MSGDVPDLYLDSCVSMSYLNGDVDRVPHIEELLRRAQRGQSRLHTSILALTEVAYIAEQLSLRTDGSVQDEMIDRLLQNRRLIRLVRFDRAIALDARRLVREAAERRRSQGRNKEQVLKPPDAIHLASAKAAGVRTFLSYDTVYAGLRADFGFEFAEPRADIAQGRLSL